MLNQHGWSIKEMVLFCSILLVFFLIAIFNIMRLYHNFSEANNGNRNSNHSVTETSHYSYEDIENQVLEAGLDYYNEFYDKEKNVKITVHKMKKQGMLNGDDLIPIDETKECSGYVLFEDGEPSVYIKCQKYITNGYEES